MPRKKFLIIILLLFGTSCSKDDHSAQEQKSIGNVRSVTVEVAKPMAVEDFFTVAGIVKARRSTVLSSKVTGTVTAVAVNAGDRVRKEQTLVQIDNRELRAELASANAALDEVACCDEPPNRKNRGDNMSEVLFKPIGVVRTQASETDIRSESKEIEAELEIFPEFEPGLEGIDGYSHLFVLGYFNKLRPDQISPLQVKPVRLVNRGFKLEELRSWVYSRLILPPARIQSDSRWFGS